MRMLCFFDHNNKIAWYSTTLTYVTSSGNIQLHSFSYARRDVDRNYFFAMLNSITMTSFTFICYRLTFTMTCRTSCGGPHLPDECITHTMNLARAMTSGTFVKAAIGCS